MSFLQNLIFDVVESVLSYTQQLLTNWIPFISKSIIDYLDTIVFCAEKEWLTNVVICMQATYVDRRSMSSLPLVTTSKHKEISASKLLDQPNPELVHLIALFNSMINRRSSKS